MGLQNPAPADGSGGGIEYVDTLPAAADAVEGITYGRNSDRVALQAATSISTMRMRVACPITEITVIRQTLPPQTLATTSNMTARIGY